MIDLKNFFREDEQPLDRLLPDGGFCGIFRTIGCIGDSLSSGEFQTQKKDGSWRYTDMFEYSWGQVMARTIGSKVYNFSKGGMTAREYMQSFAESKDFWAPELACQAYILALGTNDLSRYELGTMADVQPDWHKNADTFAGHYAAIIQRLKQLRPNAKFFLMTIPLGMDEERNAKVQIHARLIHEMAEHFSNCYVMDFARYFPVVDRFQKDKFWLNGHLSPCGYILTARMVMSYMDYIIRRNIKDFDCVGFIGREELLQD